MKLRERTYTAEFASGVRAKLSITSRGVNCEWDPDLPRTLPVPERERFLQSYRTWRDDCLTRYAAEHGMVLRIAHIDGIDALAFCAP